MRNGCLNALLLATVLGLMVPARTQPPMTVDVSPAPAAVSPASPAPAPSTAPAFAPAQAGAAPTDASANGGGETAAQHGQPAGTAGSGQIGQKPTTDAIIQYDPETDSIIVITDEATNQQIMRVIETLDQPAPQVLIKVLFLEVTHTNDLNLGAEASLGWNQNADGTFADSIGTDFGVADAVGGGGFYRILDQDLQVTLRALARVGKTNVLSRPSIMTRNNQLATITVGQEIPFIINSRITDDGQTINTIRYDDIGIILQVTPRITEDRLVQMLVAPEISNLTAETVPISSTVDARVIALRSAETSVVVADGKTVVIGGLMQDTETDIVTKVPILGDIPLLGMLFRRTASNKVKTELLIFLTPYVVDSPNATEALAVRENNKAHVPPEAFTPQQQDKFLDDFGPGVTPWNAKP